MDVISFDNSRLIHKNFSGVETKYNRAGDRNFSIVIEDEETAQDLINQGLNVKVRPPREDGENPFMYLGVKVKFQDRPELARLNPNVFLKSGKNMTRLDADTIGCLDNIEIERVDLDINVRDWEIGGKSGRSAYLKGMCVTQRLDRFGAEYAKWQNERDEDCPFD